MVKTIDSNTARDNWRAIIDEAAAGAADIVITRYGKPAIAIIAYEEFAAMEDRLAGLPVKHTASRGRRRKAVSARTHRYFNSARKHGKDERSVEEVMSELRDGRYHAI